jgi:transcriptional regulator with XRE-family HTH domain
MEMAEAYKRLDRVMDQRRVELRMSWRDVAQVAGISEAALRTIRRGRHAPTDLTAAHIDDALQWTGGTVKRILAGDGARGDRVDDEEIRAALQAAMQLTDPEEMRAALLEILARMPPASDS